MLPDAAEDGSAGSDADGSLRFLVGGLRVLQGADGSLRAADTWLPVGGAPKSLELPARLGGGFVFFAQRSEATSLWHAPTWTGTLEPLANLDFDVGEVVAGFDRLYVADRRSGEWLAIDLDKQRVTDLGPLPPSPAYENLVFADDWLGAAEVPLRGPLVTFDAGASYVPLDLAVQHIDARNGRLSLLTRDGARFVLTRDGQLQQSPGEQEQSLFEGAGRSAQQIEWAALDGGSPDLPGASGARPFGRWPLHAAVLRGIAETQETALVAGGGALGRVRLGDGKLLKVAEGEFPAGAACQGLLVGEGVGFVCGLEGGKTTVHAFRPPFSAPEVLRFDMPRYVASSGNGSLVIRGGCSATSSLPDLYCIRDRAGALRQIRVRGDVGAERVAALRDGRVAVLVPPRLGAPGLLTLIAVDGSAETRRLDLSTVRKSERALIDEGLWLDGVQQREGGELATWVAGSGAFVGVRVALDGKVRTGRPERDVPRASFAGPLALIQGDSGFGAETVDGGFEWREVELPPPVASNREGARSTPALRGCSSVGCAVDGWLRVGWADGGERQRLVIAERPPPSVIPAPEGGRWLLSCAFTGQTSGRGDDPAPAASGRYGREAFGAGNSWEAFLGKPPPPKRPSEVGFFADTDASLVRLRGYVWGPEGASWERAGKFALTVFDRFSVASPVWSTVTTQSPWADAVTAAQAFGDETGGGSPTSWSAALDASGDSGVLLISAGGPPQLFVFERDRGIVGVADVGNWTLPQLSGAARVNTALYFGSMLGSELRVFAIEAGRLRLVQSFALPSRERGGARLLSTVVRTARGDGLGVLVRSLKLRGVASSWYIYPLDLNRGSAGEPVHLAAKDLAKPPRACDERDNGYLLEGSLPLEPHIDLENASEATKVRRVEARLIASSTGDLCVDALAAELEAPETDAFRARVTDALVLWPGRDTSALALRSPRAGRRWSFRCAL